eukprot:2052511-Pyramimonas_sp.AAC.1
MFLFVYLAHAFSLPAHAKRAEPFPNRFRPFPPLGGQARYRWYSFGQSPNRTAARRTSVWSTGGGDR